MMRVVLQLLIGALGLATLDAAGIRAQLSTQEVAGGQGALLSLTVEGDRPDQAPAIPQVENLVINPRGQSTQVQMVNGNVTRSVVYTYVVGSYKPGEYVIPAITVNVAGQPLTSLPLKLRVRQGAADPAGDQGQGGAGETKEDEAKRYGYLTFELVNKDRAYVYPGEIAPVRIKAYFPLEASVSLKSLPRPEGSAFTLHNLSTEPEQNRESVDGKGYLVVTWYGGLSATKVGKYPARLTIEGTVAMRDRSAGGGGRRGSADPFFGGSLFDDLMAPMIPKEVTLTTPEAPDLEVKDLPEGRPEGFTGAIGQFQFDRLVIPDSLSTGEPCRLEAQISGTGNFALLKEPQPLPAANWKVYHGTEDFTPKDVASFSGQKAFRYSAVPLVPGEQEVALGFSYFDPDLGEYKTVTSTARQVAIGGKAIAPFPTAPAATVASTPPPPSGPQLAPLKDSLGSLGAYRPLSAAAWFVPALAGCLLAAAGLGGFSAWRRRHEAPALRQRRALEAALQGALAHAAQAVEAGDAVAFFSAARDAVRLRVAGQSGIKPEAVTLADVTAGADPAVAELLREADRWDYSGGSALPVGDLQSWQRKLLQCLGLGTASEATPRAAA